MRRLDDEERALWAKVIATVRPLRAHVDSPLPLPAAPPEPKRVPIVRASSPAPRPQHAKPQPGVTLDASWDRRLGRGLVQPDLTVDLHGHNLATAYALLDRKLEQAIALGARVILLITGKPPASPQPPIARGAIRAAIGDWLAASRHAGSIAAVRGAHPRHGGTGALYIVLRRQR